MGGGLHIFFSLIFLYHDYSDIPPTEPPLKPHGRVRQTYQGQWKTVSSQ